MSNVHGLGGAHQRANNRQESSMFGMAQEGLQGAAMEDELRLAEQHRVLFVSGRRSLKNPREENYWDMLVFGLCPNFEFLSLTSLIILADIAVFIFELTQGIDSSSNNLLQMKTQTVKDHGGNSYELVRQGQVYRLLSAIFLHSNFMHIFGNLLVTFMFLSRVEYTFGKIKTTIIYLVAGIAANIFGDAIRRDSTLSVGASTSLYGIIGVIMGYLIVNWNGVDLLGPVLKCQIYCTATMIIVFILVFTPSNLNGSIDYFGHLGGFLAGMWLAGIHTPIVNGKFEKVTRVVLLALLAVQLVVCFVVVFVAEQP